MRCGATYALMLGLSVAAGAAAAQDASVLRPRTPQQTSAHYRQPAEVLARYGDVPVKLDAPALQPGRHAKTSQEELETFLVGLARPDAPMVVETLTTTPQGRAMPILLFTRERLADAGEIRAARRPIVWLIGQQHGNEPAGGEAMLALASALARGELRPLLDRITVVIVPRANPDGAAADQRDTSAQMDLNRDHATLTLPEARALHAAIQRMPPDLVIDAHEFSVANRWIEKFGAIQAVDLMLLDATHPMVPEAPQRLARERFQPAMQAAMAAHGLTVFPYHTTTYRRTDRSIAMGGNAPGIARNAFGLMGAVSFLLETRGVGIGLEAYQRRVATHYIAIRAALQMAAAEPDRLRAAVAEGRREIVSQRGSIIVRHHVETERVTLPMVDPVTGAARAIETTMGNSKRITVAAARPWPAGYVLLPEAKSGVAEVRALGAATCIVSSMVEVDAEMFEVHDRGPADVRAINPDATVKAVVRPVRVVIPAGSVFVPATQAAGRRIALALEPDAPGSLVAVDIIRTPPDHTTVPVVRIPVGTALPLTHATAADAEVCASR